MMRRATATIANMFFGLAAMGGALIAASPVTAQAQTLLTADARYPRAIELPGGELIATVLSVPVDYKVKVFSSKDHGKSFQQVGTIDDPEFAPKKTSSPSLFRLPKAVGKLAAGTLIVGLDVDTKKCDTCRSKIKIYQSGDNGRSWSFVSVAVQAANSEGLWEPDFSMAADGALVMHYADETSDCCSQKLVRRRTYDGVKWIDHSNTVALMATRKLRPGMPVVSKLANGSYLMTYEVCGQVEALNCESHFRTSADGWNYGPTDTIGTKMVDAAGNYFSGTPVNVVLADGTLLWMGKYLRNAKGEISDRNGMVIFASASGSPTGPWTAIPAPVTRPRAVLRNNCDGYSPGLRPIGNSTTFLMITARLEGSGCNMYFATGAVK